MTEEQFKKAERIMDKIRYLETAHKAISSKANMLSDRKDKDSADMLADMLIDISKEIYGRWCITVFIDSSLSDIIKRIKELREELEEL